MSESETNYNLIFKSLILQGAIIPRFPLKDEHKTSPAAPAAPQWV